MGVIDKLFAAFLATGIVAIWLILIAGAYVFWKFVL